MKTLNPMVIAIAWIALFVLTSCRSDDPGSVVSTPVSEEVRLATATGTLHGTLLRPAADGNFPVVLLIAGSGPTDRNGNSPLGVNSNYLKMLADSLAQHGIASLRYDKRGVAASQAAGLDESALRFDHYVADAVAWVEQLEKDPRLTRVAVLGHSEGSLIGMLAVQQTSVAAFVSLAGAAQPADSLILEQLREQPAAIRDEAQAIFTELRQGRTVANVSVGLQALFRPSVQPYLISWIRHNPAEIIAKLSVPILIVQGTTDLQVSEDEAHRLAVAQSQAKLVIVEGMNHVLKNAPTDPVANGATYADPTLPLADGLVAPSVVFLETNL